MTTEEASRRSRERFGWLLLSLIAAFGVQGVGRTGRFEQVIVTLLLATTLLLALWVAETKPLLMRGAAVVALVMLCISVAEALSGNVDGAATRMANGLLVALAPTAVVIGVIRNLRSREQVTMQAVFGALCLYLLLGMFFAYVYGLMDRLGATPFFTGGISASVAHCLYYSFTTMTTVGYGDLTAASNLGHTLSVSEALFGQIYLVTVVSVIIGNLGRDHGPPLRR